jgi:16S rRNA (guanine527-N7)-methyltransferase
MTELTDEAIARALSPYLPVHAQSSERSALAVTPRFCDRVRAYTRLLLKWNRAISLTTVTDPHEILRFHFGESIFAASFVMFQNGRLADFGAGAGFPGLPIRMAISSMSVTLVEANLKKCAFLAEVIRQMSLPDVEILKCRVEDLKMPRGLVDFVVARAFGQFELLLAAAKRILTDTGQVILWLGERDCATLGARRDWLWRDPERIPNSQRRFILIGSPRR